MPAELEDESRHRALRSRDARFDGVFFTGVTSTGIYCRPVCPTRTPKAENCRFFPSASSAEQAGFRPCLRCRPELAPKARKPGLVGTLMHRLQVSGDMTAGVAELVAMSGFSERHLRRQFLLECGMPPVAVLQTRRLLFAKQLLQDTSLPVTDVAYSAGFRSLRRFNALFRERYGLAPTAIRMKGAAVDDTVSLRLDYRPPLHWPSMLAYLRYRLTPGMDMIQNGHYLRTVTIGSHTGWLRLGPGDRPNTLKATVPMSLAPVLGEILARVRMVCDLDAHPQEIDAVLGADPVLGPYIEGRPGLRVPGAWSPFELASRTVLGQQVSVAGANTLMGRLALRFGQHIVTPWPELCLVSAPAEAVAAASVDEVAKIGMPGKRAEALRGIAQAIASGGITLLPGDDVPGTILRLKALPGIGEWTAQYLAMRALRHPDAFPAGDLGLRKALATDHMPSERETLGRVEAWRPWRSYAALHLWLGKPPTL
ncbi:MAG: adenosine deaminase [Verrucomicrobiaceae bacterium]|nr:adenosine deaminase [Verrucomicrobiaceae bacterium]